MWSLLEARMYERQENNSASSQRSPHSSDPKNTGSSCFITSSGTSQATTQWRVNRSWCLRRNNPKAGGYVLGRRPWHPSKGPTGEFVKATTSWKTEGIWHYDIAANLWVLFEACMKAYGQITKLVGTKGKPYTQVKNHQKLNPPNLFDSMNADEHKQINYDHIFDNLGPGICVRICKTTKPWAPYSSRIASLCRKCVPTWICRRLRISPPCSAFSGPQQQECPNPGAAQ